VTSEKENIYFKVLNINLFIILLLEISVNINGFIFLMNVIKIVSLIINNSIVLVFLPNQWLYIR